MIVSTVNANIVGSCTNATEIVIKPQESIELICYNNEFILIGKCLSESIEPEEPTEEPETTEPENETPDLEAGLPEIE
jgi:hypothetical protein